MKSNTRTITASIDFYLKGSKALIIAFTVAILFAFIFISTVNAKEPHEKDLPEFEVQKAVYDFGLAVEGEKVAHDFLIRNRGKSVLHIQKVKTG